MLFAMIMECFQIFYSRILPKGTLQLDQQIFDITLVQGESAYSNIGMLTLFSQCNFTLEFPEILSQIIIGYHKLIVTGNSKIMHRWILINMPYSVTYVNSACFPSTIKCAPHAISFHLLKNSHRLCNYKMFAKSMGRRFIFFVLKNLKNFKPLIYNKMSACFKTRKHKLGPHKKNVPI